MEKEPNESVKALTPNRDGSPFSIRLASTSAERTELPSS